MLSFLPDRRALALTLSLAALTAACVRPDDPGLALTKIEANLVFGVKEEVEVAPTPAEVRPISIPVPDLFIPNDRTITFEPPPQPPPPACPETDEIAVEFVATANVPYDNAKKRGERPREGVYRWVVKETQGIDAEPVDTGVFELRAIRNVRDVPRSEWSANPSPDARLDREVFRFEEVRNLSFTEVEFIDGVEHRKLVERFLVNTYQVDTDAIGVSTSTGDAVTQTPRSGDPERGVALLSSVMVDGQNQPVPGIAPFRPSNGLLLLPLPVPPSALYQSVAVDPASGKSVTLDAAVGNRERIDACGKLVDGWQNNLRQTTASAASGDRATTDFDYYVRIAPQHGGVLIWEYVYDRITSNKTVYQLGQFTPDPLPEDGLPR